MSNIGKIVPGFRRGQTTTTPSMVAFDSLPRPIRDALNEAVTVWSPHSCLQQLRKGASVHAIVAWIKAADRAWEARVRKERDDDNLMIDLGL